MEIPREKLLALNEQLPRGSQKEIAKELGYSEEYVSSVLNGKATITKGNSRIVLLAQKKVEDDRAKEEELLRGLDKTLSE